MPNEEKANNDFKPLFSQRRKIASEAVEYLTRIGADPYDPFNIVGALSTLGYLKNKE